VGANRLLNERARATITAAHGAIVKTFVRLDQTIAAYRLYKQNTRQ